MAIFPSDPLRAIEGYIFTDRVAVFTQDYTQVFRQARSLKATVREDSKVMEHPLESGATTVDHRIVLPVEIELSMVLQSEDYQDVYKEIRQYYLNGTLLIVQTRANVYTNQLIQAMPHDEDTDLYDALSLALKLKQVQFVEAQYGVVPKNPKNSTTVDRGVQQSKPVTEAKTSSLLDASRGGLSYIRGLL